MPEGPLGLLATTDDVLCLFFVGFVTLSLTFPVFVRAVGLVDSVVVAGTASVLAVDSAVVAVVAAVVII